METPQNKQRPARRDSQPKGRLRTVCAEFRAWLQLSLEYMLLRGTSTRLILAALLVILVSVLSGGLTYILVFGTDLAFEHVNESVWWAFLRLTDPGYLGDDEGYALRSISTFLTVSGYVLFMGVLVAILTQGLNEKIRRMERGTSPVSLQNHFVLIGWSARTPSIVRQLMVSEHRVLRFLQRLGEKRLRLVILMEEVGGQHLMELREFLGKRWRSRNIILRSGSALRPDHLQRVDLQRAAAVLLPARDRNARSDTSSSDDATIKTILSISSGAKESNGLTNLPFLVAELHDSRKISIAESSYNGPIELIAGDEVISRMMAQMLRHPQISHVHREILTHGEGNEIFIHDIPVARHGQNYWDFAQSLDKIIALGLIRTEIKKNGAFLDFHPQADTKFQPGDKVVYLGEVWSDLDHTHRKSPKKWTEEKEFLKRRPRKDFRVLILGWSLRMRALMVELASYQNQRFHLTIASRVPVEERLEELADCATLLPGGSVEHVCCDSTLPDGLKSLNPGEYDAVLCFSSDLPENDEEADARTLVAYTLLRNQAQKEKQQPQIIVELLDAANIPLVDPRNCEYLARTELLHHILVQVALRKDLNTVYRELFNSGDTEILFRDPERYDFTKGTQVSFHQIQGVAHSYSEIAMGVFKAADRNENGSGVYLNPGPDSCWEIEPGDQFVVLHSPKQKIALNR